MLFFNANFICYYFYPTKKREEPIFGWAMLFAFVAATVHGLTDQTFILKLTGRILYMLLGISLLFERWEYKRT